MNNIFNFNRFGKVLVNDLKTKYITKFFTITGIALFPFVFVLISFFRSDVPVYMEGDLRCFLIFLFGTIIMFLAPFIIYGNVNRRKRGTDYIMLPASSFEKYLSMLLVCIVVVPVTAIAACFAVDAVAATIFPSVIRGYSIKWFNSYFDWDICLIAVLYSSATILGNLVFRIHKIIATLCIGFIVAIISFTIAASATYNYALNSILEIQDGTNLTVRELIDKYDSEYENENTVVDIKEDTTCCYNNSCIMTAAQNAPTKVKITKGGENCIRIKLKGEGDNYLVITQDDYNQDSVNAYIEKNGCRYPWGGAQSMILIEKYWRGIFTIFEVIFYAIPVLLFILGFFRLRKVQL